MDNALTTYNDMSQMAKNIVKSGMFAMKTEEQALCLMAVCQAEGLHPMQAVRRYHIMNGGRPAMRADAMQAEFQRQGGTVKWIRRDDKVCCAEFSHASGGTVAVEWTIDMAQKAGLTRNQTWVQYPRQMLTARVVSEGVRTVLPGVVAGIYTPEEVEDFGAKPPEPPPAPAAPALASPAPSRTAAKATASKAASKVEEGQFTPAPAAAPEASSEGSAHGATTVDPEPQQESESPTSDASPSQQSLDPAGQDSQEGVQIAAAPTVSPEIAALPDKAPAGIKEQRDLAKTLFKLLPKEEADALKADLAGAADDAKRQTVLQNMLDNFKAGF